MSDGQSGPAPDISIQVHAFTGTIHISPAGAAEAWPGSATAGPPGLAPETNRIPAGDRPVPGAPGRPPLPASLHLVPPPPTEVGGPGLAPCPGTGRRRILTEWRVPLMEVVEAALGNEPEAAPQLRQQAADIARRQAPGCAFELLSGEPGHVDLRWGFDDGRPALLRLDAKGRLPLTHTVRGWLGCPLGSSLWLQASIAEARICLRPEPAAVPSRPSTPVITAADR